VYVRSVDKDEVRKSNEVGGGDKEKDVLKRTDG